MLTKRKNIIQLLLLFITVLFLNNFSFGQSKAKYINPTGTYRLDGKTKEKNGEVYGYTGTIQVKTLSNDTIAMTFYICKGAPSYNSGDFEDTLFYDGNKALYVDEDTTLKCITTFIFSRTGVTVSENPKARLGSCWGYGVVANGHFTKRSSKVPILVDPLTDEKL